MNALLTDPFAHFIAAVTGGILFGFVVTRLAYRSQVDRAVEQAKQELEVEKAELSDHLGVQFSKMREGLLHTLEAYDTAVKGVEEKLKPFDTPLATLDSGAKPLELEHRTEETQEVSEAVSAENDEGEEEEAPAESDSQTETTTETTTESAPEAALTESLTDAPKEVPVNGHGSQTAQSSQ